jgi:energy-coupling factor transporter ATP-binding protein EcfA2/sirohydrochlorin ferrochelatase
VDGVIAGSDASAGGSADGAPALFVIGHGSRDAAAAAEFARQLELLGEELNPHAQPAAEYTPVGGGFIEIAEPHVDVAIDRLVGDGATDIVAVPYVLFGAGHLKDDGPATLARARDRHPQVRFRLARDLGVHPLVLAAAEHRCRRALTAPGTRTGTDELDGADDDRAVVLVSRGSTDPDAVGEFVKFARMLQDGRGLGEIHPAFEAMARPDVTTALDRARRLGARTVAVVPLFLFTGVLVRRIGDQVAAWAAEHLDVSVTMGDHLGADRRLAATVIERYREACEGDVRMNCDVCSYRVRLPGYEDKVALPLPLAPHGAPEGRGWRARRQAGQIEREAQARRNRPRRGLGRGTRRPGSRDLGGQPAIEIERLAYAYPDGQVALHQVDLRIEAGERVAMLGPNGAGKTTVVLHLLGVLTPRSGSVRVAGMDVGADLAAVRRLVGVVFQDPDDQLFSPSVRADVAFGPAHQGLSPAEVDERVDAALAEVGLENLGDRAPHHLSIGQRRRAALATVLAMAPEILVLDEPTANLDPASRRDLVDIVAGLDLTILTVTHDLSFAAELCARCVVLDNGVVAADGPTNALLSSAATMAAHRLELPYGFAVPRPAARPG